MVFACPFVDLVGAVASGPFFTAFPNVTLAPSGIAALSRFSEGFSTITLVKEEQLAKANQPMLVTLFGIVMLVKEEQKAKAASPMLVTLFGIVMLVKDLQPQKVQVPMLVTPSGIVMLVKDVQL